MQRVHPTLKCSRCGYVFPLPRSKKQPTPRAPRVRGEDSDAKQLVLGGEEWSIGDLAGKGALKGPSGPVDAESEGFEDESALVDQINPTAPATPPPGDWGVVAESHDRGDAENEEEGGAAKFAEQELELDRAAPAPRRGGRATRAAQAAVDDVADEVVVAASRHEQDVPDFAAIPEPEVERSAGARRAKATPRVPARVAPAGGGWLTFAALVAVAYLAVTSVLLARPAIATRVLGSFAPFADLSETVGLARSIGLSNIRADYQRVEEDRRELDRSARRRKSAAFVISGTATSAARQAVRDIRVRATLLGADDQILADKEVYCGMAISPEVLAATDAFGITVLESIQPPPRFAVGPGAAADFVVVFVDPPEGVVRHSVEVVAARPAER